MHYPAVSAIIHTDDVLRALNLNSVEELNIQLDSEVQLRFGANSHNGLYLDKTGGVLDEPEWVKIGGFYGCIPNLPTVGIMPATVAYVKNYKLSRSHVEGDSLTELLLVYGNGKLIST